MHEDAVIKEILQISDQLKSDGITSDELTRAKGPFMTSLKDSIRTNQYWLNSVLSLSSRYPQQLDWPITILSDYSSMMNPRSTNWLQDIWVMSNTAIAKVTPEKLNKEHTAVVLDKKRLGKPLQAFQ